MNEKNIENKLSIEKFKSPLNIIFLTPNIETAPKVGIESKKEIFAESNLLKLSNLAAVIVIPDLLTPGINDNT
tara:strand:+ start:746 stop:964 length:219 start_codon:yes stop_codon:yes gene_type:complete